MSDPLSEMFGEALANARASERLHAVLSSLKVPVAALQDLGNLDPDLAPEISAAADHLLAALEAVSRAGDVLDAKYRNAMERCRQAFNLPPDSEGD